jgi:glycosyltransferase involved in cell wall biosynthesis
VLLRYLRHARDGGHQVLCLVPPGGFAAELAAAGIRTRAIPELTLPAGVRAAALTRAATRWPVVAARLCRAAAGADLVLVNGFLALPAVRLARLRAPVAWLAHDVVRKPAWQGVLRGCAPAVTTALCVSDAVAASIRPAGIQTRLVRNGTPWPVPPARPDPAATPVVGASAVLTSWKGQHVLLEAVAALPAIRLELIGGRFARDGRYAEQLARRAAQPDLAGRVRILGHLDDPLARMRGWTVAVSASVQPEAAPLAVLEAMSLGLPLVGTDHGGTPEVLGDAGLLVPPGDPAALAAALRRLIADPRLHRRCAAAGPAAIAAGLRLQDAAGAFLAELELLRRPVREPR